MSLSLILSAALLVSSAPETSTTGPEMRVAIADLDFSRTADQTEFVRRVRVASRDYCVQHLEIITPDRLGDPSLCRAEMRRLAYRGLPQDQQRQFAANGRFRAVR